METNTKSLMIWGGAVVAVVLLVAGLAYYFGGTTGPREVYTGGKLSEEVSDIDWVKGPADAKVTIVEYSDFQCPACSAYAPVLEQLLLDFPNDVRLVYRDFPLPYHRQAELASSFAEAAGLQGKYWEAHAVLFANQEAWAEKANAKEIILGYADALGLNKTKLTTDMNSKLIASRISDDKNSGTISGVDATPSFFINGEKIINPRNYGEFSDLIQSIISESAQ